MNYTLKTTITTPRTEKTCIFSQFYKCYLFTEDRMIIWQPLAVFYNQVIIHFPDWELFQFQSPHLSVVTVGRCFMIDHLKPVTHSKLNLNIRLKKNVAVFRNLISSRRKYFNIMKIFNINALKNFQTFQKFKKKSKISKIFSTTML